MPQPFTPEENETIDRALAASEGIAPVAVQLDVHTWMVLIAHVQLGLKHPEIERTNSRPSRIAERTARQITKLLPKACQDLIASGW